MAEDIGYYNSDGTYEVDPRDAWQPAPQAPLRPDLAWAGAASLIRQRSLQRQRLLRAAQAEGRIDVTFSDMPGAVLFSACPSGIAQEAAAAGMPVEEAMARVLHEIMSAQPWN